MLNLFIDWVQYLEKPLSCDDIKKKMLTTRYIGGALRRIRIKDDTLESLYSWYIIKSIEMALKRK